MAAKLEQFVDRQGCKRWRVTHKGRVLADSGEGYRRAIDMRRALNSVGCAIFTWQEERGLKEAAEELIDDLKPTKKKKVRA